MNQEQFKQVLGEKDKEILLLKSEIQELKSQLARVRATTNSSLNASLDKESSNNNSNNNNNNNNNNNSLLPTTRTVDANDADTETYPSAALDSQKQTNENSTNSNSNSNRVATAVAATTSKQPKQKKQTPCRYQGCTRVVRSNGLCFRHGQDLQQLKNLQSIPSSAKAKKQKTPMEQLAAETKNVN
jgi:hypothetical protein